MADTCSGESNYYQYDTGTTIIVEVCSDITTNTQVEMRVQKPDGTETIWSASMVPGETSKIKHVVGAGDWDQAGVYKLQAYVALPGWTGLGDTVQFRVLDKFS